MVLVLVICLTTLTGCFDFRTDEEKITDRVNDFITAYNTGDMEEVIACFDATSRNMLEAMMGIGEGLFSEFAGVDISMSDMFALGVGFMSEDPLSMVINDITITSDTTALVTIDATITISSEFVDQDVFESEGIPTEQSETLTLPMVKEDDDWYIDTKGDISSLS